MGRTPCCDKDSVRRGQWTPEEDNKLLSYVTQYGTRSWRLIPNNAGMQRCWRSCRLRWTNYLRPDLKHGEFTDAEEQTIIKLHSLVGARWSVIAAQLPGRTDNHVRNHWNTKLKKKLSVMGIDPVTHMSFSDLMTELATRLAPPQVAVSTVDTGSEDTVTATTTSPKQGAVAVTMPHDARRSSRVRTANVRVSGNEWA